MKTITFKYFRNESTRRYIDNLLDLMDKNNNSICRSIKMKPL